MKKLLLILFISNLAHAQEKDCPAGYSWMPSMSTSSLIIVADECLPDSICKKMWIEFSKNMCGEMGLYMEGGDYSYHRSNTWVNDSIGCSTKETYKKKVKGKWVEISKCLYVFEYKGSTCYELIDNKSVEVPCCGHIHKTKPN